MTFIILILAAWVAVVALALSLGSASAHGDELITRMDSPEETPDA